MTEAMERKEIDRVAPRYPTEAAITCRPYASTSAFCASNGVMCNFSSQGSYIETSHKFHSGAILIVRVVCLPSIPSSMDNEERPHCICLAEVKWRRELDGDSTIRYGIGLKYLD